MDNAWCEGDMMKTKVFFNSCGQKVCGFLFKPEIESKYSNYTVIIIPGFRSTKEVWEDRGEYLCKEGFECLVIELRGRGESEGIFEEMTLTDGIRDVKSAIDFVQKPVILFGSSYGGMVAIHSAKKDERVKGLILRKPVVDAKLLFNGKLIKEIREKGFFGYETPDGVYDLWTKKLVDDMLNYNSYEAIKEVKCPLIIFHGDKDEITPIDGSRLVFKNANEPKKFIELKDEGHETPIESDEMINKEIVKWLRMWFK